MKRQYDHVVMEETGPREMIPEIQATEELVDGEVIEGNDLLAMTDLKEQYLNRLEELGVVKPQINQTRLKNTILDRLSHLQLTEQAVGRCVYLVGSRTKEEMLRDKLASMKTNLEEKYRGISEASSLIRDDCTTFNGEFNGDFKPDCQKVPPLLLFFVRMILEGRKTIDMRGSSQELLSMCQLLLFNMKHMSGRRHRFEPPLPVYLALKERGDHRSKEKVTQLHHLGLSVSYKRITTIELKLQRCLAKRSHDEGVVMPDQIPRNTVIIGAADNFDHNTSATTAQGAFHGTCIMTTRPAHLVVFNHSPMGALL
jgi:hypothetical protein